MTGITYVLARYAGAGNVWARCLLNGVLATKCRACKLRRLWVAASAMDTLSRDKGSVALVLSEPKMQRMIGEAGLDPAWFISEVVKTVVTYPASGLTDRVRKIAEVREVCRSVRPGRIRILGI